MLRFSVLFKTELCDKTNNLDTYLQKETDWLASWRAKAKQSERCERSFSLTPNTMKYMRPPYQRLNIERVLTKKRTQLSDLFWLYIDSCLSRLADQTSYCCSPYPYARVRLDDRGWAQGMSCAAKCSKRGRRKRSSLELRKTSSSIRW